MVGMESSTPILCNTVIPSGSLWCQFTVVATHQLGTCSAAGWAYGYSAILSQFVHLAQLTLHARLYHFIAMVTMAGGYLVDCHL